MIKTEHRLQVSSATTLIKTARHWPSLVAGFVITSSSLFAAQSTGTTIPIDIRTGMVGGVSLRQDAAALEVSIGSGRIKKTKEVLEGDSSPLLEIDFAGHKLYKHWNAFSFTDPAFRTKEGLGVGSTVGEFERIYGPAQVSREEGCSLNFFEKPGIQAGSWHFSIDGLCTDKKATVVKELWVW